MSDGDILGYPVKVALRAEKVYERLRTATSEEEAIEALRGESMAVFQFIDEKPGWIDSKYGSTEVGWVWLRRARNNPDSNLFDVLKET